MSDQPRYEYDFDPDAPNNTAASIYRFARSGGTRVLDIGSGPGIVSGHLARHDGRDVTCIDADEDSLVAARERGVQTTHHRDLDTDDWAADVEGQRFDVIILADVLEHLRSPGSVLEHIRTSGMLADDGFLVVSIPNAAHEAVITELLGGRFNYQADGLLDNTHIRWFTRRSFLEVASGAGFEAVELARTERSLEQTEFRSGSPDVPPDLRRSLADLNDEARTYQFVFRLVPGAASAEIERLRREREELSEQLLDATEAARHASQQLQVAEHQLARAGQLEQQLADAVERRDTLTTALGEARAELDRLSNGMADDRQLIDRLRGQLVEHRHAMAKAAGAHRSQLAAQKERTATVRERRRADKKRADDLQKQIDAIHRSATWRIGLMGKRLLTPAVFAKRVLRRLRGRPAPAKPPVAAKPNNATARVGHRGRELKSYLTPSYRLTENRDIRNEYEAELARSSYDGTGRRVAFAVFTDNLDEARGDIYVAVGLGRQLRRLGWDVIYVPRQAWGEVPPDTEFLVAMLPTLDPTTLPPGVRPIAWIRNEADTWAAHRGLDRFEAILCSSRPAIELIARRYAGPIDLLPIGVDTELFRPPDEAIQRSGVATTVNQWGRERQTYAALRSRPIEFPLAIYGNHVALGEELQPHVAGLVSYFSLPSLYQQVDGVLDDLNHTTKPFGNVNSRVFESLACGAGVITNSSLGLGDLGLDAIPSYVANTELHELCADIVDGGMKDRTAELTRIVREQHSFEARARRFDEIATGWSDQARAIDHVVAFYPDFSSTNPYQTMLYSALPESTLATPIRDIFHLDVADAALERGQRLTVHLHWTSPILGPAKSEGEAADRTRRVLEQLDRAKQAGARIVWTIHNGMPHEVRWISAEAGLRQELALRADDIHVMCDRTVEDVAEHYHLPSEKINVIPHSSYVGIYPAGVSRDEARDRLGISPTATVYAFVGSIRPYKGVDDLLDAFAGVRASDPSAVLVVAGRPGKFDGVVELEDRCRTEVGVLANFNTIPDEQLQLFYKAADVAVFPYRKGLNSGAVNLAFTFGTPVVAPAIGCLGELLTEDNAESFVPGDVASLQAAMERAVRLRADNHRRAAAAVAHRVPPEAMASAFADLVEPADD